MALSRRAVLAIAGVALVILIAGALLFAQTRGGSGTTGQLLVFAEFGATADRVYTAPPTDPAHRTPVTTIEHVADWGINPALAPAGSKVAYTVLPPSTTQARADSPAEVWVLNVRTGKGQRLAGDADLRVPPVFSPDGAYLVYRASASGGRQALYRIELANGTRRSLYETETAFGMFPVGFAKGGALVFASLSNDGTDFYQVIMGSAPNLLMHASDQLARDWRLSPAGDAIAYLAPLVSAERVAYRLEIARIEGGTATRVSAGSPEPREQYGAAWRPEGDGVTVGQQPTESGNAPAITMPLAGGTPVSLTPPARGFDQPLAWSRDGGALAVRSFDGTSSADAGRESTAVIERGQRRALTGTGDIIFFGWVTGG
jgi:Tol biopolymer transport system component